jgi:exosortase N
MNVIAIPRVNSEQALVLLLASIGVLGGIFAFTLAYFSNTNVLIGACLFPFSLVVVGPKRNNFIYILLLGVFATLAFVYEVRIFYFFALSFYFLWVAELFIGRLSTLVLFLFVFMSPFFIQVVTILGFPLRLMLSTYAGTLLNAAGTNVEVQGNVMIVNGEMFSVDDACMGLNMLVISMLMGVFVLAYRYKTSETTLGFYAGTLFFSIVFVLNIITNVIRIIALVYFRIPPEDPMHEVIGILCLITYVMIPLHFLGAWLIRKYGTLKNENVSLSRASRGNALFIIILPVAILFVGKSIDTDGQDSKVTHANVHFGETVPEKLKDGVTKIATDDLLIYVKTIPEFFTGEHTPLMCWKGSGYEFAGISTVSVDGLSIYKGTLINGGSKLHTAWWFSNGSVNTISQLDWRMRMLKGETGFCLVNVTASDEDILMKTISSMLTTCPILLNKYEDYER